MLSIRRGTALPARPQAHNSEHGALPALASAQGGPLLALLGCKRDAAQCGPPGSLGAQTLRHGGTFVTFFTLEALRRCRPGHVVDDGSKLAAPICEARGDSSERTLDLEVSVTGCRGKAPAFGRMPGLQQLPLGNVRRQQRTLGGMALVAI